MAGSPSKPWFAAKRYGYGSSLPIAWQGWVAMATLILLVVVASAGFTGPARFVVPIVAVLVFAVLCAFKTEGGWRWRWGEGG
ncbi:hypothetical protein HZF05_03330 [Sphingomonas sp. CGMCC 1.13654]|uniref:DUF4175 domain-containing protein n=1 Tax=Sphingomonas chungangi TaxID=2683589 RepID=A0A838L0V2_9SPHN|nr:hypothetical protein [Sphingomonas chungangi]MBA2933123.1 hypothetical protein [Sphingomonas chungangi]MVW56743.1 hypothetical protein [Sphingomonas chungangi]